LKPLPVTRPFSLLGAINLWLYRYHRQHVLWNHQHVILNYILPRLIIKINWYT